MKKLVPLTAIVMLCLSQHVCADEVGGGVQDASRAATVETAAAPTGEKAEWLAGEAYPTLVREGLKRLYEALKSFWLTLAFGDLEKVADHVMDKLWWYLFGSRPVQEESWHKFRTVFRSYLREWWLATPLVPVETLKTGVWQALQRLAGKDGQAVLGGLPEYEKVRKLVHEGKADVVGRWVEEIRRRMTQGVLEEDRWHQWKGRWGKWGAAGWGSAWGGNWHPNWGNWGSWGSWHQPRWGWHGGAKEGEGVEWNGNWERPADSAASD